MKQLASRALILLVAVVLLAWLGYHLLNYNNEIVKTETVFKETVSRSLSGRGIAVRSEQPLSKVGTGSEKFLYPDGTKVGLGQTVVEYYTGKAENRNVQNLTAYEKEVLTLQDAQNKNINNFSTAGIISRDIREQLALIAVASSTGRCSDLDKIKSQLTELVNRRAVAIGNTDNYESRIDFLESKIETLASSGGLDNLSQGNSPASGFFAKYCDGFESKLDLTKAKSFSIDDYLALLSESESTVSKASTGKIITNQDWLFAIAVPTNDIEWVRVGQMVDLSFNHIPKPIPANVHEILIENNKEQAVVVFSSDYISEDVVNLRYADVKVLFSQFSGLRINSSSFRFETDPQGQSVMGVYVLENHKAVFKKVDPIYEEEGFALSKTFYSDLESEGCVKLYDNVIIQGDVYDGKVIQ